MTLTLGPLISAIAAGNCVVVKPSEVTPASSALIERLLPRYVDSEAVRVIEGDATLTQQLLAAGFDHAIFTGGTEIGKKIMAGAASTLTPVTLELGGKCPVIVTADVDLDIVARRIAWVKLINSGQTCIAPDYVLVQSSVRDAFVDKIVSTISATMTAEGRSAVRVVNTRQFERLEGYLRDTTGKVVLGGKSDAASLTMEPTVIVGPDASDTVMREEIFGPILPIVDFEVADDAIHFVNRGPKPLATYVFTGNAVDRLRLVNEIPAGGTVVNHLAMHYLVPQLPFGGVGASGMGAYHGWWGFEAFSHRRAVLAKRLRPDPQFVYPPYSDRVMRLIRRVF